MTSSVGIVGTNTNQTLPAQAEAPQASSQPDAHAESFTAKLEAQTSSQPISPRIIVDPLAGVITQFLGTDGQMQSQIPSAAVVAYLRAGLTPEGYAKPAPDAPQKGANENGVNAGILA